MIFHLGVLIGQTKLFLYCYIKLLNYTQIDELSQENYFCAMFYSSKHFDSGSLKRFTLIYCSTTFYRRSYN